MQKQLSAISNHATLLGGGEYSFTDLLSHMPEDWSVIASIPGEGELTERLKKNGINTKIVNMPAIRPWLIWNILVCIIEYLEQFKKSQPDLVYCNGSRAAFYAGIASRILKIPVIWHCRIATPDFFLDYFLGEICNRIIANSHATAKRFKKRLQPKIRIVHNGVDIPWLTDKNVKKPEFVKDDWKVILVVARASRWKRHDRILAAFDKVAKTDPSVHLICVGAMDNFEPEWWSHLQILTKKSAFSNRIHWIGKANDVRPWYRSAQVLVLSSENEPFGRVLVEAMSHGIPVIATRNGGVPEIVRHGQDGFLTNADNAEEISEYLHLVLNDRSLQKKISKNAIKRAQHFNLDNHVIKILDIFNKTIL